MTSLTRIIYISRSTFAPEKTGAHIEPNVARILAKSRINNQKNGLVGVLYFGDGNFFQCLEGESETIDTLYAKLQKDTRHEDVKLLSREHIDRRSFAEWTMKYVPLETEMKQLLKVNGYEHFDPYSFNNKMVNDVLSLLKASIHVDAPADNKQTLKPVTTSQNLTANFALIISVAALVVALIAFFK